MADDLAKKNKRLVISVFALVFFMIGLSFAAVPLYDLFCRVTGFGGTPQISENFPDQVLERTVRVRFNATTDQDLPWTFKPVEREITTHLGQDMMTSYIAANNASVPTTGMAIYNVSPLKAGQYFHKVQCFCFANQTLPAGKEVNMPVAFYVDPAMHDDPNMDDVQTITLSYTFYAQETEALDHALEAFYTQ